jgi:TRAP-type C4-dicarboxylate transport system substrate-binding protein
MKMRRILSLAILSILFGTPALRGGTLIRIGTTAPARSPWSRALDELAADWERLSGGAVQVKIYAGGIIPSDEDLITRMRQGTLDGAALSSLGLLKIQPDLLALLAPFLTESGAEFRYVLEKMKPVYEKQIEEKGYKPLFWSQAGWTYFFTKEKIAYPEDLKKARIAFPAGEPEMAGAWERMGYQVVPTDLRDLMAALQSGAVSGFYLTPLLAGTGQYYVLATHMLDIPVSPALGGLMLTAQAWGNIPGPDREPLLRAVLKAAEGLSRGADPLEGDALKSMRETGLIIDEPPAGAWERWHAAAAKGMAELEGRIFSKETADRILALTREFRKKSGS